MSRPGRIAAIAALALVSSAHVGSPDTYFEGPAGPYHVRVIIRTPGVVPGLAQITVRLLDGTRAQTVTVLPVFWNPRTAAPPPADTARIVSGDSSLYGAALWLMTGGSYGVRVTVTGAAGTGVALVPVVAIRTRRLELERPLALGLTAFGLFLFIGVLTITRAAWREAVLPPGQEPDARRRRLGWVAAGAGGLVVVGALVGGRSWWNAVDRDFSQRIYQPLATTAEVRSESGRAVLRLGIVDSFWRANRMSPLIPDHGHLMHLFLVRDDLAAFAHLHPVLIDSSDFDATLPPLPVGRYRLYADITRETGFAETLTDTIALPGSTAPGAPWRPSNADDAWTLAGDSGLWTRDTALLDDGSRMVWDRGAEPLAAGRDLSLRFRVSAPDGRPAALEPYMGMAGHLMLTRDDGSVFVHLHPLGTISWAAQQAFLLRGPADTVRGTVGRRLTQAEIAMPVMTLASNVVSFPYAFPTPGRYRVWVEVKRSGRILTGVFDAEIH